MQALFSLRELLVHKRGTVHGTVPPVVPFTDGHAALRAGWLVHAPA